jgi:hypothetical protein
MSDHQTLKQALVESGDQSQVDMLTKQAQDLTKTQLTDLINGKKGVNVDKETTASIRRLARHRVANGQNVMPWSAMKLEAGADDDNMGGGIW